MNQIHNKKHFIIDGKNINNLDAFYDAIQQVLCPEFAGFGRNLDAFNDILRGGFGAFDDFEPIILEFKNRSQIINAIGLEKFKMVEEIIHDFEHVEYIYDN